MSSTIFKSGKISGHVCQECGGVFKELYGNLCNNCKSVKDIIKNQEKKKDVKYKDC